MQLASPDTPVFAVPDQNLIPVDDYPSRTIPIQRSPMFVLSKYLGVFAQNHPGRAMFDASQGDGGASLPGTPREVLERALELQIQHGTGYDGAQGTEAYRRAVIEKYWQLDPGWGITPANVSAVSGGRDGLIKAYQAMMYLGTGRAGDALLISRVPWLCYIWSPYALGMNAIHAPGREEEGWAYSEEGIRASVEMAGKAGRKIGGMILTSPDNPTGVTQPPERQAALAKAALEAGISFVLFDWMYHRVTDDAPMNLNTFLQYFTAAERKRLIFLDGITKCLGGSNIRNCHLIASDEVTTFIANRATHQIVASYFSTAVAQAAYELGIDAMSRGIVEPTNQSRRVLVEFLDEHRFQYHIGKGYYAFINMKPWLARHGMEDTRALAEYLGKEHGLAVVPGVFFSPYGKDYIRFSYALPPEKTLGGAQRLVEGLQALG